MRTSLRKTLAFVFAASLGAGARAQGVSDLMPTPPQPSGGAGSGGGLYLPGMPLPQPQTNVVAPTTTPDGKPQEKKGLNLGYDDQLTGAVDYTRDAVGGDVTMADRGAEFHTVVKGDTLWGIAGAYLGSSWNWPKLWAMNPSITNPHWIFPGDVLRLRNAEAAAPTAVAEPVASEPKLTPRATTATGLFLRQTGFVEPKELEDAGKIAASREEKLLLSTDDEAYVQYKKGSAPKIGDKLSVYTPSRVVKHPTTGKKLGYVVEVYSDAEVLSVSEGKLARIRLKDAVEPSERGYRVGPLRRQFKIVESKKDTSDVTGVIVDMLRPGDLVGSDILVFLDCGRKSGLDVGNRLLVTRRGDGYVPILSKGPIDDKRFPRETIAEVLVVDVRDTVSTGLVLKATKEARIGDRVEGRSGL